MNCLEKNNLSVQYSLNHCPGDGFNIFGTIKAKNIFAYIENHKKEKLFTEEEKERILFYENEFGNLILLPENKRYFYCMADRIEIADDWEYWADVSGMPEVVDRVTLKKFENVVKDIFQELCRDYEELGYKYFYEISDREMQEICVAAQWEFLSDGDLFRDERENL